MAKEYRVDYVVNYSHALRIYTNNFYTAARVNPAVAPVMTYTDVFPSEILNFLNECKNRVQDKSVEFCLIGNRDIVYNIYFKNKEDAINFKLRFGNV